MKINNAKKNTLVQESMIEEKKDLDKKEEEKKPEIELTNIKVEEEDDDDNSKLIETPMKGNVIKIEEIKHHKIDIKNILLEIIFIIFNCSSFVFYYLSLEGCFLEQDECIPLLSTMFLGRIVIFGLLAAALTCVQIYLIIFKVMKFYHLIYMIIFYIYIYYHDHGTKLDYHGAYNIVIFIIFVVIFFILAGIIIIIIITMKNGKKIPCIILTIILFFLGIEYFLFFYNLNTACQYWDKGLNNTVLDNSEQYDCKIEYPKKCYLYQINKFFDFSRLTFSTCNPKYNHEKENIYFSEQIKVNKELKDLSSLNHFGYPITVNNPLLWKNEREYYDFPNLVLKNIILMDLYEHPDKKYYGDDILKPEVEIIYDKNTKQRKIEINLNKNESLSEERKKIENDPENQYKSLYKNIIFVFIDCISRQHFLRIMPKTSSFLEKFMSYNLSQSHTSYQFMKYQAFAGWTNPNLIPMFYSSEQNNQRFHFLTFLKQNGFVTCHSQNFCSKESFEYSIDSIRDSRIKMDEYDHENVAMFCDPNHIDAENPYPIFSGPYSILRRCIAGYDTFNYVFEYSKQFWNAYKDNKKYLRLGFQDSHEFSGQVGKYLDEPLYNFFNELYKNNLLEDTAIFFASDHGNSYFNYFYYYVLRSDDSMIEKTYGMLHIMIPNNKNEKNLKFMENINSNQQSYITPFDIHDTIIHIIYGDNLDIKSYKYSQKGNSLLTKFENKFRNCKTYYNDIVFQKECLCEKKMPEPSKI